MKVTVSPKYQVVIPLPVREALGLLPGMRIHVFTYDNRIELIPEKSLQSMRGFLKGITTDVDREEDRL